MCKPGSEGIRAHVTTAHYCLWRRPLAGVLHCDTVSKSAETGDQQPRSNQRASRLTHGARAADMVHDDSALCRIPSATCCSNVCGRAGATRQEAGVAGQ